MVSWVHALFCQFPSRDTGSRSHDGSWCLHHGWPLRPPRLGHWAAGHMRSRLPYHCFETRPWNLVFIDMSLLHETLWHICHHILLCCVRWFRSRDGPYIKENDAFSLLRPETVESLYYLWTVTKDSKWRDAGWEIFQAIEKVAKVPIAQGGGYSSMGNVNAEDGGSRRDSMESFFLAETLKYLFLLFDDQVSILIFNFLFFFRYSRKVFLIWVCCCTSLGVSHLGSCSFQHRGTSVSCIHLVVPHHLGILESQR